MFVQCLNISVRDLASKVKRKLGGFRKAPDNSLSTWHEGIPDGFLAAGLPLRGDGSIPGMRQRREMRRKCSGQTAKQ